ncbi:hypothetical protein [Formosa sp. A9]|uniref:hypothetical protein n=1 Tax=Formosa sp. A9 TaxID=3442641 RepID=UPI003EBD9F4E
MKKEQLQDIINQLNKTYSDFSEAYFYMTKGKNKQIRDKATRDVERLLSLAKMWIKTYPDCYVLYVGEHSSDFDRALIWDELSNPRYFKTDIPKYIEKLKRKVETL